MKKLFAIATLITGTLTMVSCGSDDAVELSTGEQQEAALEAVATAVGENVSTDATATGIDVNDSNFDWTLTNGSARTQQELDTVKYTANISEDATWSADVVHQLDGRITVLDGATLTIEAGAVITGNADLEGVNAAVLMIARGGKLMAMGTAANPIIMTTTADDGNLTADNKGLWGGLVMLGKAPISEETVPAQIEGVPADDTNGLYGGTNANDNSGTVQYVSIRHGGAVIDAAAGDEINGFTLGGVGSGTTIDHIEIYANSDDGIEFFGGNVDVDYLVVTQVGDDAIDIDQSYSGEVSNYLVTVDDNSDEGLEIDGREGDLLGGTADNFTLTNGTIQATGGASITCDFKSKARGTVNNLNANGGQIKLSASFDTETLDSEEDAAQNVIDGNLVFTAVNATFSIYTDDFEQ
ncbi:hypothetical protein [Ekhidna sp. To15]|uniref:hypothetical protein n=1 Tax=Ekhidna sp. To15 TaxID=3395267 RepID=UPI003F521212